MGLNVTLADGAGFYTFVTAVGAAVQFAYNDPTISVAVAGAAGGAVRWYLEKEPLGQGLWSVGIGAICAEYLGPFAISAAEAWSGLEVTDDAGKTGAFLTGLFGVGFLRWLTDRMAYNAARAGADKAEDEQ